MKTHGFQLLENCRGISRYRHRDNRLDLFLAPSHAAPVISFGVVYRVGARHETDGQTGATHFLEHLMFKGTERFNREAGTSAARLLQRVGASYNATTWLDRTCYFETVPKEAVRLAADIEADRMRHALIRQEDVDDERGVILNELDRGENEAFDVLLKALYRAAYTTHPYGHPTIGRREDVEKLSARDLRSFYDSYYHPRNASVLMAGDFDEEEALDLVEEFFAPIPAGPSIPGTAHFEVRQSEERRVEVRRAGELYHLVLAWHIPEGRHEDLPPLVVLGQLLSDGVTSRLQQALVESGLCLGVHAYPLELHDPGLFQVLAVPAPGTEVEKVEAVIHGELARLLRKGPTPEELQRARIQTRTDLAFQRESPGRLVSAMIESVAMGDWKHFPLEMEKIAAVTAEGVQDVLGRHLRRDGLTTAVFIPEGAA